MNRAFLDGLHRLLGDGGRVPRREQRRLCERDEVTDFRETPVAVALAR